MKKNLIVLNCHLNVDKSNGIKKIIIKKINIWKIRYIYSVWDMKIRKILTMSRPCPHQQHSLKETIKSNVLPDMCVGPVMNCGRKLSSISSQNILSIAWLPALKETGKSVDQLIGGKLTPPTKTMELNSALFGREKLKSWRISSEEPGGQ